MTCDDEIRAALMGEVPGGNVYYTDEQQVEQLLPIVRRIAEQRAAAELREAASDVDDGEFSDRWSAAARASILARADELDPT